MPTHKERILAAMRGEMVDVIPFVPRLDLWWLANRTRGALPEKYQGMMPDDISRTEGWAWYHMVPNFADVTGAADALHRSIGLFKFKQSVYGWRFSSDVEVQVEQRGDQQLVEYHTPVGSVRTLGGLTRAAMRAGSSLGWVEEHVIKKPEDYRVVAHLFANMEVFPQYEGARAYAESIGENGVAAVGGPSLGASPMHMIQKEFIDPTQFFYDYRDHPSEMRELADCVEVYFEKALAVIQDSPAEVVLWGANYDDMLTYPPYFEKEILPWLQKAAHALKANGKIVATHTDGENHGLMDLIRNSGVDVAESVTPWPMTKVRIEEYYRRWRDRLTIMGGIPESVLLEETATDEEFEAFLDTLFAGVAPGDRLILGTADSTPPDVKFERLHRIQERVDREGRLPLRAGAFHPIGATEIARAAARVAPGPESGDALAIIQNDVIDGDGARVRAHTEALLGEGISAQDILHRGALQGRGGLHPGGAAVGSRHERGVGRPGTAPGRRRSGVGPPSSHRNGVWRHARHWQEHGRDHAQRRGVRGSGHRRQRSDRSLHSRSRGIPTADRLHLGAPDHHDAGDERDHRSSGEEGAAGWNQDSRRRSPSEPEVR
jgi:uroporphyrinogen-III decarboxylase